MQLEKDKELASIKIVNSKMEWENENLHRIKEENDACENERVKWEEEERE